MKKLLFFALISICAASYASCDAQGCNTKIKRVYATAISDGRIYLQPDESSLSNVNCSPAEGAFFVLKKSHPSFNEIYSMALASVMSGASVRMRITENTNDCELSYMWVWSS